VSLLKGAISARGCAIEGVMLAVVVHGSQKFIGGSEKPRR
jgi:hypothetical protein